MDVALPVEEKDTEQKGARKISGVKILYGQKHPYRSVLAVFPKLGIRKKSPGGQMTLTWDVAM